MVVIANVVFPVVLAAPLGNRIGQPGMVGRLWNVFVQLELVRRWGAPIGIFVANVLYTVGPLH